MKEKIRIFVCNKCCNTAYTTDVSIPGACTSQYWVRTSGICGGHYSEIEGAERAVLSMTTPHFDWVVNQEVEKRIKERMPSEEEIRDIVSGKVPYYRNETEDKVETKCFWFDEETIAAIMAVYKYVRNRMSNPNTEGRDEE